MNVDRCVVVPSEAQAAAVTDVLALFEHLWHVVPAAAAPLRGSTRIYGDEMRSSFFRSERQAPQKDAPSGVVNRFCEVAVDHPTDVQGLVGAEIVPLVERLRCLP